MLFFRKLTTVSVIAIAGFAFGSACSEDEEGGATGGSGATDPGSSKGAGTGSGDAGGPDGTGGTIGLGGDPNPGAAGAAATPGIVGSEPFCFGVPCQCVDGIDNDDDGTADGFDLECQFPFDNDEGSFATGIPQDNSDFPWVDCFFDPDFGSGNDYCRYPDECLTGMLDINSDECALATSQECIDYCGPRTPNGCDCFGCCTIELADGPVSILTLPGCDLESIDDEMACPRCEIQTACQNTCGECELCPGRTEEDLPASCTPDPPAGGAPGDPPPGYTCEGADVCSDTIPCPGSYWCSFGCCILYSLP